MSIFQPTSYKKALERLFLIIVRQSSPAQAEQNLGSGKLQFSLVEFGKQLGWPESRIEAFDARGESGSRGERRVFRRIIREIKKGRVGALAFARNDRLGRTALESEELLRAAAENGTLIITEGRIYNPSSASDKLILGLLNQFAEYENNARTMWMMATRFALAKEGAYRVVLPTGLIAASPNDEEFVEKLKDAGLASWLNDLDGHKAVSRRGGQSLYVLPYPDREVFDACEMRIQRFLSTGTIESVIDLVNSDPAYPRPGLIPITKAIRRYHPEIVVRWSDVNHPYGRAALRKWLKSPALYGTYAFKSPGLEAKTQDADADRFRVRIEGAFPSFAAPSEEKRARKLLEMDKKPWREGSYEGRRPHFLSMLRCGHRGEHGERCGHTMTAMYQPDGSYGYYSHVCRYGDHPTQHVRGSAIDPLIEATIVSILDSKRLRVAISGIRTDERASSEMLKGAERELRGLEREIEGTRAAVVQAEIDGDTATDRKIFLNASLDEQLAKRQRVQRRIETAREELGQLSELVGAEREKIIRLASDIPRLFALAREVSGDHLRILTSELVEAVYFERVSGFACKIEIVFPGGASVNRSFMTRRLFVPRTAIEYAAGRLAEEADAEKIAAELNIAPPKNHTVPWDAERVETAPFALQHQEMEELRGAKEQHRPLSEFAEAGVDEQELFIAAVHGDLGPGYYADGELHIHPTTEELHRWVPSIARAHMAREMVWPIEEVITRAEASQRTGLSRYRTVATAKRGSGVAKDAARHQWVRSTDYNL